MNTDAITRTEALEEQRMRFLPEFVGAKHMMRFENLVYVTMEQLCSAYRGGFWRFYILSNGGRYMAPHGHTALRIQVEGNGYDGHMSPDAAGIVATLFALNRLMHAVSDPDEALIGKYYALQDFASQHTEAQAIFAATD